jgi:hypothetical protein
MSTLDDIRRAREDLSMAEASAITDVSAFNLLKSTVANQAAAIEAGEAKIVGLSDDLLEVRAALAECQGAPIPIDVFRLGVNEGAVAEFESKAPTDSIRVFDDGPTVLPALTSGDEVVLSIMPVTTPAISAVVTRYRDVAASLVLMGHHEPENDYGSNTSHAERARLWQAEQRLLIPFRDEVEISACLMCATYQSPTLRQLYVPAEFVAEMGYQSMTIDAYLRAIPWTPKGFDSNLRPALTWIRDELGLPARIGEWAVPSSVKTGTALATSTPAAQEVEVRKFLDLCEEFGVLSASHFNEQITKADGPGGATVVRNYRVIEGATVTRPLVVAALNEAAG